MRPYHYRMKHRLISCVACLALHAKPVPAEARDWLRPENGHAMFLTVQGKRAACQLGPATRIVASQRDTMTADF